jgi:chemotaxis protein MotB
LAEQNALIANLTAEGERQAAAIASFEEQVAALLAENRELGAARDAAEAEAAEALSQAEALDLALATARSEIDAAAEAARLDAARREALEALIADLETDAEARDANWPRQRRRWTRRRPRGWWRPRQQRPCARGWRTRMRS